METYKIGRIGKPHGINGEVVMQVDDDIFDTTESEYVFLQIDGLLVPFFFEEYRFRSEESALVKFEDIDTQERARQLTGCDVYFPRDIADNSGGEMSWAQIRGFIIHDDTSGKDVGRIASVDDSTLNTLFELEDGTLIPVAEEFIKDIDKHGQRIIMQLPEGLLSL